MKNGLVTFVHTHVKKDEAIQSEHYKPKLEVGPTIPMGPNLEKKMEKKRRALRKNDKGKKARGSPK